MENFDLMQTQIGIIGAGPAGLLLSQMLSQAGIASVLIERQSREHVQNRIRAGILEAGSAEILRAAGVGERMDREGLPHDGIYLSRDDRQFRVDFQACCGHNVLVYGQTELTRDLYATVDRAGTPFFEHVEKVTVENIAPESNIKEKAILSFVSKDRPIRVECDFIAGCDGFHGISRTAIPEALRREYERIYPFAWLGLLADTPPVADELIYSGSRHGFALASMRSPTRSRYYLQVPVQACVQDWSDAAFWRELKRRLPEQNADVLVTGPSLEKSIAPLRSFVSEPMRWGRLFLCGDAAHIVPPTGAKGLNLAISDVNLLTSIFRTYYHEGNEAILAAYSDAALRRVWNAVRFSWMMTHMLHNFPDQSPFENRICQAELACLEDSASARVTFSENYVGIAL